MASPIINIKFIADLKEFSSQMQNANRSIKSMSNSMKKTGASLTAGLTLPLVGLGALALKTFSDFEQEMAKVKAISGATSDEFKLLTENAKKLGATTKYTASEVAELQLNYSKLGFDPSEILQVTDATLALAAATGEDLADSATVAASTLRGFGLEASETTRVTDVMAKSFSSSALDLEKFKTSMAILAPVAKSANVSLEEATGYLSVLVNAGIDASTAGTGLRNIFLDIAESGMTLDEALYSIVNSTNQNATAMDLFGKRGATVASVLAENYTQAKNFAHEYKNASGAAAEMAGVMNNTLQGAFLRMKSAMEGAMIAIGEQLAPVFSKLADFVSLLLDKFNNLSDGTKKFIVILGGIAAAIGPLMALAGTLLPAIATGFTILTGPIGIVIAALTSIGVVIYKHWEPIKKTLVDIANYFIDLYNESTLFRIAVEAVTSGFKNMFDVAVFVFDALSSVVGLFIDQVKTGFSALGKIIKGALTFNWGLIQEGLKDSISGAQENLSRFVDNIKGDFKKLSTGISENINEAIDNVTKRKKIEFIKENVDASAVEEAVKEAVDNGLDEIETPEITPGGRAKVSGIDTSELSKGLSELTVEDPTKILAENTEENMKRIASSMSFVSDTMKAFALASNEIGAAVGDTFLTMTNGIVDSLDLADSGFEGFVKGLVGTITKLISMMLASSISQAISGAVASGTATGPAAVFTTPGFIATAVGGVMSAFAAIPKFEYGGIVGGSSYYGDKILARVNSGELILNQKQQRALYNQLNFTHETSPGVLTTKISGSDIILVTERESKKQSRRG